MQVEETLRAYPHPLDGVVLLANLRFIEPIIGRS